MSGICCPQESARSLQGILIRLTTFLLACVLLALQMCNVLSQEDANICRFVGFNGIAFYFALELVADQRANKEQLVTSAGFALGDQRLAFRLFEEQRLAKIRESELRKK